MGHYASEMDPYWTAWDTPEYRERLKADFRVPLTNTFYECPTCSALVVAWKKHQAICKTKAKPKKSKKR
jgi:hypothetical protein